MNNHKAIRENMSIIRNRQNIVDKSTKEYILARMEDNPSAYNPKSIENLRNAIAGMKREKVKREKTPTKQAAFQDSDLFVGNAYWVIVDGKPFRGILTEKIVRLREAKRNRTQLRTYKIVFAGDIVRVVRIGQFVGKGK